MNLTIISDALASMVRIATPLILMALGGLLCDRAGVFNIALEGFALIGAFAAIAVVQFTGGNVAAGLVGAMVIGAIYSALYGVFVVKFKANHIISSIAMNTLGIGLTAFLLRAIFDVQGAYSPDEIHKLSMIQIPVIKDIPILSCLSGQSIVTYLTIFLIFVFYILLFKTKMGLSIRAVGESEEGSKTAGIRPDLVKWQVILMSGALCGLAGAYLSTISVSQFSENMIQGRGFMAYTAFVFGGSHPVFAALVSFLFGLTDAIGIRVELMGLTISPSIISMFPYIFAIVALAITSYMTKLRVAGVIGNRKKKRKSA